MAKHDVGLSDLMNLGLRLPWHAGIARAVVCFLGFHWAAAVSEPITAVKSIDAMGPFVVRQFIHVFAGFLQYIVPVGLLIGACGSFLKKSRGK